MNSYLLFKSLHLIAVISWMAGLLYLPRIFVYHVENIDHKISSGETFDKILNSYSIPSKEILKIKKAHHKTGFFSQNLKLITCGFLR